MSKTLISLAALTALAFVPAIASAQESHRECRQHKQGNEVAGAVIGGIGGALLGNAIGHGGGREGGTIIGGVGGAAAGAAIGAGTVHCDENQYGWYDESGSWVPRERRADGYYGPDGRWVVVTAQSGYGYSQPGYAQPAPAYGYSQPAPAYGYTQQPSYGYRQPAPAYGYAGQGNYNRYRRGGTGGVYPQFRDMEQRISNEINSSVREDMIEQQDARMLMAQLRDIQAQEYREYQQHGWNLPYDDQARIQERLAQLDRQVDDTRNAQ